MTDLGTALDEAVEASGFSGVVRVDRAREPVVERAFGLADRARGVALSSDTRIGIASGAKGFTALTVLRLVEEGVLSLDTRARDLLGGDLPLINDRVTIEHLLSHRSGIGDYLDEDELDDPTAYVLAVPVHRLETAESYLAVLDGHPEKFPPGTDFSYCNGGFCVLALLAERAAAEPFHDLVHRHVIEPAGLHRTAYLRSDELPADAALGYLGDGPRTNVLHLPVRGGGDGGIFTTAGDMVSFWEALYAGRIVSPETRADLLRKRTVRAGDGRAYGLGLWLWGSAAVLVGSDAGASFRSAHVPGVATWSVLSNTTEGAWPVVKRLDELLVGTGPPR